MRAHHRIAAFSVIVIALSTAFALPGAHYAAGDPGNDAAYQTIINVGVAAINADRAGNYQQAMPLFRQVASDESAVPNATERASSAYFGMRSDAREKLAEYHEKGLGGLAQDYGAAPPCILQRRFPRTACDWHGFPIRVRAPQRVPGSWVIPGGARACSSDLSLSPPPG
jgi:hypothetical protein